MIAIVADGPRGRVYLPPSEEHVRIARSAHPPWEPDTDLVYNPRHMSPPLYGMTKHRDLFTQRQLLALTTFSDLVRECRERVLSDAIAGLGLQDDRINLESGGCAAAAYADAIATYLAMVVDRMADYSSTLCMWIAPVQAVGHVFGRQTLSMTWDFVEANALTEQLAAWAALSSGS